MASLWVGSLRGDNPELEEDLANVFSRHGEVLECWVRNAPNGPDCWGVVKFLKPSSAAAAKHMLDGRDIPAITSPGRFLKVRAWEEREPPRGWQERERGSAADQAASWRRSGVPGSPSWHRGGGHGAPYAPAAAADWDDEGEEFYEEEEEEEDDDDEGPLVELWVGNLCDGATRTSLRRAFELFGEVAALHLAPAPVAGLQFAFVSLPASAAEVALQELDGLVVYELSGSRPLVVKQSQRSLRPHQAYLQQQQRRQQHATARQQQQQQQQQQQVGSGGGGGGGGGGAHLEGPLEALQEDGTVAELEGPVRPMRKLLVAEGPPSRTLWVGNVGGKTTVPLMEALFSRFGTVNRVQLNVAPGYQNAFKFGLVEMGSPAEAQAAHEALHGSPSETICSTKPLKLRYGWPRRLVRPAGVWGSSSVSDGGAEPDSSAATAAAVTAAAAAEAAFCCAACGAGDVSQLKRCSGCRAVSFCSRECQVKAWQGEHDARACGRLAQLGRLLGSMPASDGEQAGQQLPPEALRLLLTALLQPGTRQGRMVRAAMASARPPAGPPAGPPPLAAA